MKPNNLPITSREYKLLLNPDRFLDMEDGLRDFWNLAKHILVERMGIKEEDIEEQYFDEDEQEDAIKERQTWYLDTEGFDLRSQGFTLRVREEDTKKGKYKVTLKYRDEDRYLSAQQLIPKKSKVKGDVNFKFEEDILPFSKNRFAKSIAVKVIDSKSLPELNKVEHLWKWFDLPDQFTRKDINKDEVLREVNAFKAREIVYWLGKIETGGEKVKCCASFWYLEEESIIPLIGEFSFDHDINADDRENIIENGLLESFPQKIIYLANTFFEVLRKQKSWIDLAFENKTDFAYYGW